MVATQGLVGAVEVQRVSLVVDQTDEEGPMGSARERLPHQIRKAREMTVGEQTRRVRTPKVRTSRVCTQCGEEKPISEYYKKGNTGCTFAKCKGCMTTQARGYTEANREKVSERIHRYYMRNKERIAARVKLHRQKPEQKERQKQRAHELYLAGRVNVWQAVKLAVADGRLVRPNQCEQCGISTKPDAHHEDYSRPLDVKWLCRRCHNLRHRGRAA